MPSSAKRRSFDGLITGPPSPLPDEDSRPTASPPVAAAPPLEDWAPAEDSRRAASPTPPKLGGATTVRLTQGAADALHAEWLQRRREDDPRLSLTAFASEIVMAGLRSQPRGRR